jgi:hypothetical protein
MIAKRGNRFSQKNSAPKQKKIGRPKMTKLNRTARNGAAIHRPHPAAFADVIQAA